MFAALPPIAGSTPISTPTNDDHSSRNGRQRISQITFEWETKSFGATKAARRSSRPRPIFSTSDMICANANTPISTGRNGMPPLEERNAEREARLRP